MGRKIKYMGASDVRVLDKGEDFGGQIPDGLPKKLVWDWDNKHVIDTDDFSEISAATWEVITEYDDFRDVTDLDRVPTNLAQQIWRAMPKTQEAARATEGSSKEPSKTTDEARTSVAGDTPAAASRGTRGRST